MSALVTREEFDALRREVAYLAAYVREAVGISYISILDYAGAREDRDDEKSKEHFDRFVEAMNVLQKIAENLRVDE